MSKAQQDIRRRSGRWSMRRGRATFDRRAATSASRDPSTEIVAGELRDWYRDWVTALLSHVYRRFGTDGLEACLRYSSEKGWMPWMMEDVTHDPSTRLSRSRRTTRSS